MTAVEWLIHQWPILESQLPVKLIEQAIKKERQQIIDAYNKGGSAVLNEVNTNSAKIYVRLRDENIGINYYVEKFAKGTDL